MIFSTTGLKGTRWLLDIAFLNSNFILSSNYLIILISLFIWFFSDFWLVISYLSNLNWTNFCYSETLLICLFKSFMLCFTFWTYEILYFLLILLFIECIYNYTFLIFYFMRSNSLFLDIESSSIKSFKFSCYVLRKSIVVSLSFAL